jgi:uncharacterized integral membrane protein
MLRLALFLLLFFVLSIFSYLNHDQTVRLTWFGEARLRPIPVYVLVVGAFLTGALFAALLMGIGWARSRMQRRRQQRQIEQLSQELDQLRADAFKKSPPQHTPVGRSLFHSDDDPFDDEYT